MPTAATDITTTNHSNLLIEANDGICADDNDTAATVAVVNQPPDVLDGIIIYYIYIICVCVLLDSNPCVREVGSTCST